MNSIRYQIFDGKRDNGGKQMEREEGRRQLSATKSKWVVSLINSIFSSSLGDILFQLFIYPSHLISSYALVSFIDFIFFFFPVNAPFPFLELSISSHPTRMNTKTHLIIPQNPQISIPIFRFIDGPVFPSAPYIIIPWECMYRLASSRLGLQD